MPEGIFKIDLHVHSKNSGDNDAEPEDIIEQAIDIGLDGIVFTEHYFYEASESVEPLRQKYRGKILILRGVEFSAFEGHCLVFGVNTDKLLEKYTPVKRLIEIVEAKGGVVIPAHPYRGVNSVGDMLFDMRGITAIEGYNGCNMQLFNQRALEVAKTLVLPITGGSDAHRAVDVGSCYTIFDRTVTEDNFIELLRSGAFTGVDIRRFARPISWFM